MSSKKEYVYCIWAHSKVNGPSPYIYRMVATSKTDVKKKMGGVILLAFDD